MGLRLLRFGPRTGNYDGDSPNMSPRSGLPRTESPISSQTASHLADFRRLALVSPSAAEIVRGMTARLLHQAVANRAAGFTDDDVND